jgi:hypothetical protein
LWGREQLIFMVSKRATSFDRQSCEFSIFTREPYACWSCHYQRPYRGYSDTSGEVIGTPSFEGGIRESSWLRIDC